ncbi:hypothetical protein UlMin_006217 [Ulmus minor]
MTDCSITEVSKSGASSGGASEASQIGEVKQWLDHEFGQAGKEVPQFEYTPRSPRHNLATLSQAKTSVEEKRTKVQKILAQLEDDVAPCEAKMENWKTNLAVMAAKERQYLQQSANYKAMLNRVGYTPEISHGVLVEMAEHKKELEKKTKPINKTLDSYLNLPADKALAALTVERKKREYADAETRLEDVLRSALSPSE